MSIRKRVEDAVALYELGRFEGALLSVLVAAASTARREMPNRSVGDRECFETFLGKSPAAQRIMDIEFVSDPTSRHLSLRAGGAPHYVLQLSHGRLFEILQLVKTSPANYDEFELPTG